MNIYGVYHDGVLKMITVWKPKVQTKIFQKSIFADQMLLCLPMSTVGRFLHCKSKMYYFSFPSLFPSKSPEVSDCAGSRRIIEGTMKSCLCSALCMWSPSLGVTFTLLSVHISEESSVEHVWANTLYQQLAVKSLKCTEEEWPVLHCTRSFWADSCDGFLFFM